MLQLDAARLVMRLERRSKAGPHFFDQRSPGSFVQPYCVVVGAAHHVVLLVAHLDLFSAVPIDRVSLEDSEIERLDYDLRKRACIRLPAEKFRSVELLL